MTMKILSIRVKNFRNIVDEELNPDWLTVITGEPGSGKSAFVDAIWNVQLWMEEPNDMDFLGGGWDRYHNNKAPETEPITVRFDIYKTFEGSDYPHMAKFVWNCYKDRVETKFVFLDDKNFNREFIKEELTDAQKELVYQEFKQYILDMKNGTLDNCDNAIRTLAMMHKNGDSRYQVILEKVQDILPHIEDFAFDTKAYSKTDDYYCGDLYVKEKGIGDHLFSWGSISPVMRKVIQLAVLTETVKNTMVILEEVFDGVHYRIVDPLMMWLYNAGPENGVQYIVDTENTWAPCACSPDDVFLFERDPKDTCLIQRVTNMDAYKQLIDETGDYFDLMAIFDWYHKLLEKL